jgi:ATP-dependent RNA helicase RhlB
LRRKCALELKKKVNFFALYAYSGPKKTYISKEQMEFEEFKLHPDLWRGIAEAGYVTCMPVQEQVLANAFNGQDLYVQSQTGTGKTAAFLVVIFQRLLTEELLAGKKAIIMVPTRELAVQVEEEAKVLGKFLPFKVGSFYGGVGYTQQLQMLRDNVQIMVGTPGRVLDLNKSGRMNLMDIAFLVLDEADRMFDMGFYPDLRKLIKVVPPADRRQTMLFSATLNAWVKNLAWEYTKSPFEIEIEPETVTVEEVEQFLYHVPSEDKMRMLLGILEREKPESVIIFCNTKRYTEVVAKRLRLNGYDCEFIIGDLPQAKRLKVIDDVKAGKIRYLAATDVAARGLDIEGLSMVINYDLPVESENYVHRIGRTARAGKTGKAITLASEQDVYELPDIERYIGKKIPSEIATAELYAQDDKSSGRRIHSEFFGAGLFRDREESGGRGGRDGHGGRGRRDGRDGRGEGRERDRRDGGSGFGSGSGFGPGEHRGRRGPGSGGAAGVRGSPQGLRVFGKAPAGSRDSSAGGAGEEDLSKLSFEDRMAYYRQKYKGPAGQEGEGGRPPRGDGPGKGGRDRNRRGASAGGRAPRRDSGEGSGGAAQGPRQAAGKGGGPVRAGGQDGSRPARSASGQGRDRRGMGSQGNSQQGRFAGGRDRQAESQDRPVPVHAVPEAAAENGKGILNRFLSIFKRKK